MSAPFLPHPQASPDVLRGALGRGKPLERNLPEPETVGPRRGAPGKNYPKRLGSAAGQPGQGSTRSPRTRSPLWLCGPLHGRTDRGPRVTNVVKARRAAPCRSRISLAPALSASGVNPHGRWAPGRRLRRQYQGVCDGGTGRGRAACAGSRSLPPSGPPQERWGAMARPQGLQPVL